MWSWPNANPYGTRDIASGINASNVSKLKQAWSIPLTGAASPYGQGDTSPVFGPNGTVYVQDVSMDVYAINSGTGKLEWKHSVPKAQQGTIGPEGVTLVNGVLYGETKNTAFALEASTGEQLWQSAVLGQKGSVAGFEMGPAINNGVDYLATPVQKNGGIVYALNAKTGKVMWKFHETQQPNSTANGGSLGNGGSWGSPVVADGSVFFGVANPYRTPLQAVQHPSKVLYNDSTVALNPKTGKLKWYMQAVPNDVYDWDMQIGPMYDATGPGGKPTVIDAGKMGYVYAMDASSGKLLWKTPVGKHNGHDDDGVLALEHKLKLKTPYLVCPGDYGGVETQMALANGVVYVPINNNCEKYTDVKKSSVAQPNQPNPAKGTGEVEALSLGTGKVMWDTKFPASAFGGATVTNNLVFTTLYDGKLVAMNRSTGKVVWSTQLPAHTNSALSIDGNMLVTLASLPSGKGQKAEIVAYKL